MKIDTDSSVNVLAVNSKSSIPVEFSRDDTVGFRDFDGNAVNEAATLTAYFGARPGDTMAEFLKELRALSPEAKTELALAAAIELGYAVV